MVFYCSRHERHSIDDLCPDCEAEKCPRCNGWGRVTSTPGTYTSTPPEEEGWYWARWACAEPTPQPVQFLHGRVASELPGLDRPEAWEFYIAPGHDRPVRLEVPR